MKKYRFLLLTVLLGMAFALQSCARTGNDVWEDTKSAGRHVNRGVRALGGKHGHSRQIACRDDFECIDDEGMYQDNSFQDCDYQDNSYQASEFIPLEDQANGITMGNMMVSQPRETPGEPGSSIPSIEYFMDPNRIPQLAGLFRNIYFDYNSNLIKGPQNLQVIHNISDFMRGHPNTYLFIEGNADERGPQAYNLALGSRRANAVRNVLINEGVNPDNLFTISYGKERPVAFEHNEQAWAKNRRVEFKIYER
jgi:peptidoglycan-associated lipoprotein